ncbi:hypothetical protein OLOG_00064, partial [Ostreococcus lucimarinus virus OlV4]
GLENEFKTVPGVQAPEPEDEPMEQHVMEEPEDEGVFLEMPQNSV